MVEVFRVKATRARRRKDAGSVKYFTREAIRRKTLIGERPKITEGPPLLVDELSIDARGAYTPERLKV